MQNVYLIICLFLLFGAAFFLLGIVDGIYRKLKITDIITIKYYLSLLESKKIRILFCIILLGLYFLFFIKKSDRIDTAFFGGDTIEYQSMGVNFAKGYGIHKYGGFLKFEEYKFDKIDSTLLTGFNSAAGKERFLRTPAYPVFLGVIYKIFGVSPKIAKSIQLLMLSIIVAFLPLIGMYFWKHKGYVCGVIAGAIFITYNFSLCEKILTEPLIAFSLFLILLSYIYYESNSSILSSVLLGISIAIGLLTKGSLVFIPVLLFIYVLWQFYKTRDVKFLKNISIAGITLCLSILPWSVYASKKSNSFIVLSTQGKTIPLDGNNEKSIDGNWHPDWRRTGGEKMFYNNDNMKDASPLLRVVNFYKYHYHLLPTIIVNKILRGFNGFVSLWLVLFFIIAEFYGKILNRFLYNKMHRYFYITSIAIVSMAFLILDLIFHSSYVIPFQKLILLFLIPVLFFGKKIFKAIPVIFKIYFLNFLLITVLIHGDRRFVVVAEFVFILYFIYYLVNMISPVLSRGNIFSKQIQKE